MPFLRWLPLPWLFWNSQRERTRSRNKGNGINNEGIATALPCWLCDVGCSHQCERLCPCLGCSGTHRVKEPEAATEGTESQRGNRNGLALWLCDGCCSHCRNALAVVVLELTEGTESQQGNRNALALWLTVMSVVPIVANVLALMPCVPLMLPLPWCSLNSQRERAKSRKRGKGITTRESQRPCLVAL